MLEQGKVPTNPFVRINFNVLYAPLAVAFIVVVYLLVTDMNDWMFNLGQYNAFIIEYLPHAQTWVNSSGQYREKMILIYLIYSVLIVYMVLCYSFFWIKYWTTLIAYVEYSRKNSLNPDPSLSFLMLACFFFILLGGYAVTILYLGGSDVFLTDEKLNALEPKSKHSFYAKWNSPFSFVMNVLVSMTGWFLLILSTCLGVHNLTKAYRKLRKK